MNQPSRGRQSGASGVDPAAVIVQPLGCMECRYDLRGLLVATGTCPECGTPVADSVLAVVDPKAGRLPRLRNPKRVGGALLWIMSCLTGAMLLLLAHPAFLRFDGLVGTALAGMMPTWLPLAAAGLFFGAIAGVVRLAPPRKVEPGIVRDLRRLGLGLAGAALVVGLGWSFGLFGGQAPLIASVRPAAVPPWIWVLIPLALTGMLIMIGLRGVLRIIGERSREYRMAAGGRQRLIDMVGALGGIVVGAGLRGWGVVRDNVSIATIGIVVLWISVLMLAVGMAYLVVNALWIRRTLRQPPPRLHDLIGAAEELPAAFRPTVLEMPEPPAGDDAPG